MAVFRLIREAPAVTPLHSTGASDGFGNRAAAQGRMSGYCCPRLQQLEMDDCHNLGATAAHATEKAIANVRARLAALAADRAADPYLI